MATTALRKVGATATPNGATPEPAAETITLDKNVKVRVPDKSLVARYQQRRIGGKLDFDIFDHARKARLNVLIEGPTGDGKTMAAMAYAAKNNLSFYSVPCNVGVDPASLFGRWIIGTEGTPKWVDGGLTHLVRHGGVLLINEINAMPAKVAMVLFSLLDHRREITLMEHEGEVISAHPDLIIIGDMNPGYTGTTALNAAFRNRFPIQLAWNYDPEVEVKLLYSTTLQKDIAKGLRQQFENGQILTPCSTNMLMEFEALVESLGLPFAIANFVNHFDDGERKAVRLVFSTFESNLQTEYAERNDKDPDNPAGAHVVFTDPDWIYTIPGGNS